MWARKRKQGGWLVWIAAEEIPRLLGLPARLREVLEDPAFSDKVVERLFPRAHADDPEAEAEYRGLLRDELLEKKRQCLETFDRTIRTHKELKLPLIPRLARIELAEEDLALWLGFFHDVRLLIGTRLDITDESWEREIDPHDPNAREVELLHLLGYFEETIIQALRAAERL